MMRSEASMVRFDLFGFTHLMYARDLSLYDQQVVNAESEIKPADMAVGQTITVRYTKQLQLGWYQLRRTQ